VQHPVHTCDRTSASECPSTSRIKRSQARHPGPRLVCCVLHSEDLLRLVYNAFNFPSHVIRLLCLRLRQGSTGTQPEISTILPLSLVSLNSLLLPRPTDNPARNQAKFLRPDFLADSLVESFIVSMKRQEIFTACLKREPAREHQ